MVVFDMVYYYILYRGRVCYVAYVFYGCFREIEFNRIKQGYLFIHYKVVIIRCTVWCNIAVEVSYSPVYCSDPVYTWFYFYSVHSSPLTKTYKAVILHKNTFIREWSCPDKIQILTLSLC